MLLFWSAVLFKVKVISESDAQPLVMDQRHHLREGKKWRIINRIEGGQTKVQGDKGLNTPQTIISR